ncbi:MAG: hypothetical protein V3T84_01685 [Phycisphaerales bacterium]
MVDAHNSDDRGLLQAFVADGRSLLLLTAFALIFGGLFAFFLAATGHFLPHDLAFLGMSPQELREIADGKLAHFMIHDRVAFGGALIAIGTLYAWIAEFPLRAGHAWAWWLFLLSGILGFGSFLLYLGYGYLDSWHGVVTLALLPCFIIGLIRSYFALRIPLTPKCLLVPALAVNWRSPYGAGRALLLVTAVCLALGGLIIMGVGVSSVFVPQDLEFMAVTPDQLHQLNARLVPLIAHDRAGFGGGVCCCGVTMFFCVWCGRPSRGLWQAILITGLAGFGAAIGVHPAIGYTDFVHLAPAYLGAVIFVAGVALTFNTMVRPSTSDDAGRAI